MPSFMYRLHQARVSTAGQQGFSGFGFRAWGEGRRELVAAAAAAVAVARSDRWSPCFMAAVVVIASPDP